MKNKLIIFLSLCLVLILIGSVNATHTDKINSESNNTEDNLKGTVKYDDIYIDNNAGIDGDGLSLDTPLKNFDYKIFDKLSDNGTVHLSAGEYEVPNYDEEYIIVGNSDDTIITKFWYDTSSYINSNKSITFINLTFKTPTIEYVGYQSGDDLNGFNYTSIYYGISLDCKNFNFINCNFINTTFVSGQWQYNNPNRDKLTDIFTSIFENCNFINYFYNPYVNEWDITDYGNIKIHNIECESNYLITSYAYSKYIFNNCTFENLTVDAIIDSYGGQTDHYGFYDGIYIYNSSFKKCNLNGIVKARQISFCEIKNCNYDFKTSDDIPLISPFYTNKTKKVILNETKLTATPKGNTLIITLSDINTNKTISGVEISIINNNMVFGYIDTDVNGQVILNNLSGVYNFEFSYPGDDYVGYESTSLNRTFIFENIVSNTSKQISTSKVSKKSTKITAKKTTFKKSKKTKKYTITLKSNNIPVKRVKVTIKIFKKIYKATTNVKGKATFKINKLSKKGKYTAIIKFAGNNLYKASSVKVKIIVK